MIQARGGQRSQGICTLQFSKFDISTANKYVSNGSTGVFDIVFAPMCCCCAKDVPRSYTYSLPHLSIVFHLVFQIQLTARRGEASSSFRLLPASRGEVILGQPWSAVVPSHHHPALGCGTKDVTRSVRLSQGREARLMQGTCKLWRRGTILSVAAMATRHSVHCVGIALDFISALTLCKQSNMHMATWLSVTFCNTTLLVVSTDHASALL